MAANPPSLPTWRPAPPSPWQTFRRNPALFLAEWLYRGRQDSVCLPPLDADGDGDANRNAQPIRVVCLSDTHNAELARVPDGDVLLHAGDLTDGGSFAELQGLPHRHKVVIAGNHDRLLDPAFAERYPDRVPAGSGGPGTRRADLDWGDVVYLQDSSVTVEVRLRTEEEGETTRSLTIYGSPWTELCGIFAFQYPPVRAGVWADRIPAGTDVVLVHGPPRGHRDDSSGGGSGSGSGWHGAGRSSKGCPQLLRELRRARPALVVCGHIHAAHGREDLVYDAAQAAYDAVVLGDRGLLGAAALAWWLLCGRLARLLRGGRPPRATAGTRLVNAAVAAGTPSAPAQRDATVVLL